MFLVGINIFLLSPYSYYLLKTWERARHIKHDRPMGILAANQTILQAEAQSPQTKIPAPIPESTQKNTHLANASCHSSRPIDLRATRPSTIPNHLPYHTHYPHPPTSGAIQSLISHIPPRLHPLRWRCQPFLLVG